ncbi:MAG: hypothetical protein HY815_11735 [Candidatus Riflebacteria bacterium]|nr:hypothetical protein [Candidatus Riflebacteria bacterium]
MRIHRYLVGVVTVFAGAVGAAAAGQESAVSLQFKPTAAVLSYRQISTEETELTSATRAPVEKSIYEARRELTQTVTAEDDELEVTVQQVKVIATHKGRRLRKETPSDPLTFTVLRTGEVVDGDGTLGIVLPSQPVTPGSTWSATIEPTPEFPLALTAHYVFKQFQQVGSRRCALIETSAHGDVSKTIEKPGWFHTSFGTVLFDPTAGVIVKATTCVSRAIAYPCLHPSNLSSVVSSTDTTLTLCP